MVNKINNRKVTFLIGEKAGKTTSFYWIKGMPLVPSKNNHGYCLADNCTEKNRINHRDQIPTEIPNFGLYKKDEIIIDLPVLNSKNLLYRMAYNYFLCRMI